MPVRRAARVTSASICAVGMPRFSHANAISSSTVVVKNWERGSWNTTPTRCAISQLRIVAMSLSPIRTVPVRVLG
jgi:hypothetical protein